jgi:hypothetical protein
MPAGDGVLDLERVIEEVLPICRGSRPPDDFHFDPAVLTGATRSDVPYFLSWLGIAGAVLPFEHIFIHADLDVPACLRAWARPGGQPGFYLALNAKLFISPLAVRAAIAHVLSHLYLILSGNQAIRGRDSCQEQRDPEEIRTEVAAIALGFGKLLIEGIEDYAALRPGERLSPLSLDQCKQAYDRLNQLVGVPRGHAAI